MPDGAKDGAGTGGGGGRQRGDAGRDEPPPRVCYLVAGSHVSAAVAQRVVAEVARSLVGAGRRVGTLQYAGGRVRLGLADGELPTDANETAESATARELHDAAAELSADVDGWVVATDDLRSTALALEMSAAVPMGGSMPATGWVVPVAAGEEGRVEAYRTVKALATWVSGRGPASENTESGRDAGGTGAPWAGRGRLVLAATEPAAMAVVGQLREVIRKFLSWDAADALLVGEASQTDVHPLMSAVLTPDEWSVVQSSVLLPHTAHRGDAAEPAQAAAGQAGEPSETPMDSAAAAGDGMGAGVSKGQTPTETTTVEVPADAVQTERRGPTAADRAETYPTLGWSADDPVVIELPSATAEGVLEAVLEASPEWQDCDVPVPATVPCRVVADRTGRAVLVAAVDREPAKMGSEVVQVGRAAGWLQEHLTLVARAARPIRVEPSLGVHVVVYVPTATRPHLASLVQAGVEVVGYRSLRWGGRLGLLVEAA
ncbi:MAG: hypothetical protein ACK4PI_03305 [Tepidisphaerales bacterium]